MKFIALLFVCTLCACSAEPAEKITPPANNAAQEKTTPERQTDITVEYASSNQRDYSGLKQGYWITYGKHDPSLGYPENAKIEEGEYENDLKQGDWYYYNVSGAVDSIVTYENGKRIITR